MEKVARSKKDETWLKTLGKRVEDLIKEKGYKSPYDFWINEVDGEFSRSSLNYLISGRIDPKATTLRDVANLLGVKIEDLFDF